MTGVKKNFLKLTLDKSHFITEMKEETDDMKRSVKMLFGLALGLTIGSMCSIELGIMALPLCGCVGMAIGLILGTNNKEDK